MRIWKDDHSSSKNYDCDQFADRLQRLLDQRADVAEDAWLKSHAQDCQQCEMDWEVWASIDQTLNLNESLEDTNAPAETHRLAPIRTKRILSTPSMVAASLVVFALGTVWAVRSSDPSLGNRAPTVAKSDPHASPGGQGDIAMFAKNLGDGDLVLDHNQLIDHTMPTVRNVGQGVAPLGRSLRQAVTILTVGGKESL